jgi:hypothetical protein
MANDVKTPPNWASLTAAGLVLVAFGALTWFLVTKAPTGVSNSETWTRDTYLFNAVQAIVVGAAGVLPGN